MFEDALLESAPGRTPVLRRIHYLLSALVGTLVFVQGLYLLPAVLVLVEMRALFITAVMVGNVAAAYTLLLCYVWADSKRQRLPIWPWLTATLLLNLLGFLGYLVYAAAKSGDWRRAAVSLAYVAEALLVGVLVLAPLIYTRALPRQMLITELHITPPRGRPPAPAAAQPVRETPHHAVDLLHTRIVIPVGVSQIVEKPEAPQAGADTGPWVPGTIPGGPSDATLIAVIGSGPWGKQAPVPPPTHVTPKQQIIRLSCGVTAAKAVYQPKPVYPQLAVIARIQGTVLLQAILGKDGTVQDLKVMSGHPLLVRAAMDAVKTWRYQPTLLNGEPVDVLTEISVNFTLGQ